MILFPLFFWGCCKSVSGKTFHVSVGGFPGTISFDEENFVVIEAGNDSLIGTYFYSDDEETAVVKIENNIIFLTIDYLEGRIPERELLQKQAELAQKLLPSS